MLVLIRIPTSATSQLIASSLAFFGDPMEVFDGHVGLFNQHTALITTDSGLRTKPGLSMNAMTHYTDISNLFYNQNGPILGY